MGLMGLIGRIGTGIGLTGFRRRLGAAVIAAAAFETCCGGLTCVALAGVATCLGSEVFTGVCLGDSITFAAAALTGADAAGTGVAVPTF